MYLFFCEKKAAVIFFCMEEVGCNVDLYVANHESADLLYEEQVGDASSTSNESGQDFVQFRSLSLD